ncbi:MAG: DUF502 domain-containing protein [Chloroflexi bacterium]|nr:DUF502 domain-containing protein [Chloroflexota bacterium]
MSNRFAVGLLILIPVVLTVVILQFAFEFLDGLLGPVLSTALGRDIPGVGLVALVLIMLLTGVLALSGAARSVSRGIERIVAAIPVVGTIYGIGKKMTGSSSEGEGFNRVVLVEYPRDGVWSMGFLTGFTQVDGQLHAFVYLPTAPMPNSGWIALIEAARVYDTDLSTQDAMQAVLSSGISNPDSITRRPLRELQETPSDA